MIKPHYLLHAVLISFNLLILLVAMHYRGQAMPTHVAYLQTFQMVDCEALDFSGGVRFVCVRRVGVRQLVKHASDCNCMLKSDPAREGRRMKSNKCLSKS